MNADKTYNVREIFTLNYYEIVVAGEAVKNYDEEGRTYYATRQMEFTNREFLGCFEEAEEGEEYVSEYSAPGYDENGNPVEIFMMFTEIKGEEVDPENLNWSQDADRVEVR